MKPIWIVDDDPSIRFVLEKALSREELPTRSFNSPREVLAEGVSISAREAADRVAIRRAMTQSEGNISAAAKLLGISRPTLYDLLKQYRMQA